MDRRADGWLSAKHAEGLAPGTLKPYHERMDVCGLLRRSEREQHRGSGQRGDATTRALLGQTGTN